MSGGILEVLGGIGLFLLGMAVMTQGLNSLAGESLRNTLTRFTKTPLTGTLSGMIVTALVQSSSATTVMAVGFVGAGLLSFPQALGIIFGANIGTTATGWIVALWGFTFSLKSIALPMLFVGSMLRLFGSKRIASIGFSLAGFGAVFIGVSMLQSGMEGYKDTFSPESFPPDTIFGRFLLVLLGIAITLVTQSSSAGVAAAITAVHVGNISLSQAAAMVIGMDVGTTFSTLLASSGGNIHARRTGWSHVIYNIITGVVAFALLPFYMSSLNTFAPSFQQNNPEIALVAFHTSFNLGGVIAILPFTRGFAALIIRLVPGGESKLTERLDASLLKQPQVAIESVVVTLKEVSQLCFTSLATLLSSPEGKREAWERIDESDRAVVEVRTYLNRINDPVSVESGFRQKVSALHILDHLTRMIARTRKLGHLEAVLSELELSTIIARLANLLERSLSNSEEIANTNQELKQLWTDIDLRSDRYRQDAIERTAKGNAKAEELAARLDAIRWLQRITQHALRITHYLSPQA